MKAIRTYGHIVCTLLVFIILNVSIDIPDELLYHGKHHRHNEINEVESIAEFVFEACLNEENSFPETEGDDGGTEIGKKENNWKPGLLAHTNSLIVNTLFNIYHPRYVQHYKSANYADVPYAPPCTA